MVILEHKYRTSLYLAGYVDKRGNVTDPIYLENWKGSNKPEDIPAECYIIEEAWDGVYWVSIGDEIHSSRTGKAFAAGDVAWGTYENNLKQNELEFFFCRILNIGIEYAECKLYFGEEPSFKRSYRTVKDMCVADLRRIY